jgi:hypothetical protein
MLHTMSPQSQILDAYKSQLASSAVAWRQQTGAAKSCKQGNFPRQNNLLSPRHTPTCTRISNKDVSCAGTGKSGS